MRFVIAIALALFPASLFGDVLEAVGYVQLVNELGPLVPAGSTVAVAQVEANSDWNLNAQGIPVDGGFDFVPDASHPHLAGSPIAFTVQLGGEVSLHATEVAIRFYGDTLSIAPGVSDVEVFLANEWAGDGFLFGGVDGLPSAPNARVYNHSWIGTGGAEHLARLDYSIETTDAVHVVGVNNAHRGGQYPLFANSYNAISVGLSSGAHETGVSPFISPPPGLEPYATARHKPDLVVPEVFTSYAVPYVSGAATLLIETAHENPGLSNGSNVASGQPNYLVQNAEASEVIKSALMAGASRGFVADYAAVGQQTANGLDTRFGAGQLDIYQSYHIISGGEQDSAEAGGGPIDVYGFDYANEFASDDLASYLFTTGSDAEWLAASLAWNIDVEIEVGGTTDSYTATLPNFDLALYEVLPGDDLLVAISDSLTENTENIWTELAANTTYLLHVFRDDLLGDWDYGLSWRRTDAAGNVVHAPEPAALILAAFGAPLLAWAARRRQEFCQ